MTELKTFVTDPFPMGKEVKIKIGKIPLGDFPDSIVKLCDVGDVKHLEEKLKTLIDGVIVDKEQVKAIKDLIDDIVWDFWRWLNSSCDGTQYKETAFFCQVVNRQEKEKKLYGKK